MDLYGNELIQRCKTPLYHVKQKTGLKEFKGSNDSCGDELSLFLEIQGNLIQKARQECKGCLISNVSADFLCEMIEGKKTSEVKKISEQELLELFGIKDYNERSKCVLLSLNVLKKNL